MWLPMDDTRTDIARHEVSRLTRVETYVRAMKLGVLLATPVLPGMIGRASYFLECTCPNEWAEVPPSRLVLMAFWHGVLGTTSLLASFVLLAVGAIGFARAGGLNPLRRRVALLSRVRSRRPRTADAIPPSPYRAQATALQDGDGLRVGAATGPQGSGEPRFVCLLSKRGCTSTWAAMPFLLLAAAVGALSINAGLRGYGVNAETLVPIAAGALAMGCTAILLAFGRTTLRLDASSRIGSRTTGVGWLGLRRWFVLSEHARIHVRRVSERRRSEHAVDLLLSEGDLELHRYETRQEADEVAA